MLSYFESWLNKKDFLVVRASGWDVNVRKGLQKITYFSLCWGMASHLDTQ